jgi:hypothetical protein
MPCCAVLCCSPQDRDFLLDVVVSAYQRRASQRAAINAMPLYPTEGLLWDTTQIPTGVRVCVSLQSTWERLQITELQTAGGIVSAGPSPALFLYVLLEYMLVHHHQHLHLP